LPEANEGDDVSKNRDDDLDEDGIAEAQASFDGGVEFAEVAPGDDAG